MTQQSTFERAAEARMLAVQGEREIASAIADFISKYTSRFIGWLTRRPRFH